MAAGGSVRRFEFGDRADGPDAESAAAGIHSLPVGLSTAGKAGIMTIQYVEGHRAAVWLWRRGEVDRLAALRIQWLRDVKRSVLRARGCPDRMLWILAGSKIRDWPEIARYVAPVEMTPELAAMIEDENRRIAGAERVAS